MKPVWAETEVFVFFQFSLQIRCFIQSCYQFCTLFISLLFKLFNVLTVCLVYAQFHFHLRYLIFSLYQFCLLLFKELVLVQTI